MLSKDLISILGFLKEIEKIKLIKRLPYLSDRQTLEDDAQHSWHLAIAIMTLKDRLEFTFDESKAIKLALIHDIGEIYIGDSRANTKEKKVIKTKGEEQGIIKLTENLPNDLKDEIINLWKEYENCETIEARVVKAVDKIMYNIQRVCSFKVNLDYNKYPDAKACIDVNRDYAKKHVEFDKILDKIFESLLEEIKDGFEKFKN